MLRFFAFLLALWIILPSSSRAQDIQYSQFYAAPLYLNPSFAGSTGLARAGLNYRNQWPSIVTSFVTYSGYFDYFFEDYNSGVGLLLTSDREGLAGLTSNSLSFQYAYQLNLTEELTFRPGLHVGAVLRDINFDQLLFPNQIDPTTGPDPSIPSGENIGGNVFFLDIGLGGLLYSNRLWIGGSVSHINEPNQAFQEEEPSKLPMKVSIHGGYKLPIGTRAGTTIPGISREISLTPTFQYKFQGEFDQLDIGTYLTYEPMVFGLWYRGVPFKPLEGNPNNESLIFLVGVSTNNLNIGYSFDYTLSELGIQSGGAHEISLSYNFFLGDPRRPPKNVRKIPCPKF